MKEGGGDGYAGEEKERADSEVGPYNGGAITAALLKY
jgi:hypothetical protein